MFYSFNINGKYKFLLHNLFPRGFDVPVLPKTWISIVFKSLIFLFFFFLFFFLKSKCTEHASLSYRFWKQTFGLSEEKGSGWRRRRRSQSYDARVCVWWKHRAWICTMGRNGREWRENSHSSDRYAVVFWSHFACEPRLKRARERPLCRRTVA